eukprot:scaffold743_cov117-Cylindrotheca_fusiformis.AAC.26
MKVVKKDRSLDADIYYVSNSSRTRHGVIALGLAPLDHVIMVTTHRGRRSAVTGSTRQLSGRCKESWNGGCLT